MWTKFVAIIVILASVCCNGVDGIFKPGPLHGIKHTLSKTILGIKWNKVKWSAGINGSADLSLNAKIPLTSQMDNLRLHHREIMCNSIQGKSGVYEFSVNGKSYKVLCEMVTKEGGWTLFQRRESNKQVFHTKTWAQYKAGFGQAGRTDYWLGNEVLHQVTKDRDCTLRIEIGDAKGKIHYAEYSKFRIANESDGYRLTIGNYIQGDAGDGLAHHNGMKFSTLNKDNDKNSRYHCAYTRSGAWWYNDCDLQSNLNAYYDTKYAINDDCYHWKPLFKNQACLRSSKMMFRCI